MLEVMEELQKQVGQTVRRRRKKLGLSQEALAERADTDWTYISGVERGRYNVSLKSLARLAKALECKPHELLK